MRLLLVGGYKHDWEDVHKERAVKDVNSQAKFLDCFDHDYSNLACNSLEHLYIIDRCPMHFLFVSLVSSVIFISVHSYFGS